MIRSARAGVVAKRANHVVIKGGAAMNSPRPMPTRQFLFLKAEKPDAPVAAPPQDSKNNQRQQHSHKKRLLFAIKRDLQTAATAVRDSSVVSMQLMDRLEAARRAPVVYQTMDAAALQLSQSVSLIERFVVDQLPQGSSGDILLAAWNCITEHSVDAPPLSRYARPRVVEQLRCKAVSNHTSSGSRLMFFRDDDDSAERLRISRIEELLSLSDSRENTKLHTPRVMNKLTASSPRTRFIQPTSKTTSLCAAAPIPVKIFEKDTVGDKETSEIVKSATENKHWEKLLTILGFSDQRVRTREVNKELENIRENLKDMKVRVNLMTERLDVPQRSEMRSCQLELRERSVRITIYLCCIGARVLVFASTGKSL
jgi:hypothetical protein